MCFELDESYFLGPLPEPITSPRAHWGHPLGTAMNFNSSHMKVFEYYITGTGHTIDGRDLNGEAILPTYPPPPPQSF